MPRLSDNGSTQYGRPQRWFACTNTSTTIPIPPYAPVAVTDVDTTGILLVRSPTADNQVKGIFFNGPQPIQPLENGSVTNDMPAVVRFTMDDAVIPLPGAVYGTRAGSFDFHPGNTGFVVLGGAADPTTHQISGADNLMAVVPQPGGAPFPARLLRRDQPGGAYGTLVTWGWIACSLSDPTVNTGGAGMWNDPGSWLVRAEQWYGLPLSEPWDGDLTTDEGYAQQQADLVVFNFGLLPASQAAAGSAAASAAGGALYNGTNAAAAATAAQAAYATAAHAAGASLADAATAAVAWAAQYQTSLGQNKGSLVWVQPATSGAPYLFYRQQLPLPARLTVSSTAGSRTTYGWIANDSLAQTNVNTGGIAYNLLSNAVLQTDCSWAASVGDGAAWATVPGGIQTGILTTTTEAVIAGFGATALFAAYTDPSSAATAAAAGALAYANQLYAQGAPWGMTTGQRDTAQAAYAAAAQPYLTATGGAGTLVELFPCSAILPWGVSAGPRAMVFFIASFNFYNGAILVGTEFSTNTSATGLTTGLNIGTSPGVRFTPNAGATTNNTFITLSLDPLAPSVSLDSDMLDAYLLGAYGNSLSSVGSYGVTESNQVLAGCKTFWSVAFAGQNSFFGFHDVAGGTIVNGLDLSIMPGTRNLVRFDGAQRDDEIDFRRDWWWGWWPNQLPDLIGQGRRPQITFGPAPKGSEMIPVFDNYLFSAGDGLMHNPTNTQRRFYSGIGLFPDLSGFSGGGILTGGNDPSGTVDGSGLLKIIWVGDSDVNAIGDLFINGLLVRAGTDSYVKTADLGNYAQLGDANTFTVGPQTIISADPSSSALVLKEAPFQLQDMIQITDPAGASRFSVAGGTGDVTTAGSFHGRISGGTFV